MGEITSDLSVRKGSKPPILRYSSYNIRFYTVTNPSIDFFMRNYDSKPMSVHGVTGADRSMVCATIYATVLMKV